MTGVAVSREQIESAALAALVAAGASEANARPVARAVAAAEAAGNTVCGLYYVPIFVDHLRCGKVDGRASPTVTRNGACLLVDAKSGFAHPAIDAALPGLVEATRENGIAAAAVRNSYNCLALVHHVMPLAAAGLVGICVANAPAAVAPPGAKAPLLGTNPIAFAAPGAAGGVIAFDQGMSAVTKTQMTIRRNRKEPIPVGWAQDASGNPTTDPAVGLAGSLLAAGGQKGANMALLIEVLAAALTGSNLSTDASGFGDLAGGPPKVGQFIIAIDPMRFTDDFANALTALEARYATAGVRLPGRRTSGFDHVAVDAELWKRVGTLADISAA